MIHQKLSSGLGQNYAIGTNPMLIDNESSESYTRRVSIISYCRRSFDSQNESKSEDKRRNSKIQRKKRKRARILRKENNNIPNMGIKSFERKEGEPRSKAPTPIVDKTFPIFAKPGLSTTGADLESRATKLPKLNPQVDKDISKPEKNYYVVFLEERLLESIQPINDGPESKKDRLARQQREKDEPGRKIFKSQINNIWKQSIKESISLDQKRSGFTEFEQPEIDAFKRFDVEVLNEHKNHITDDVSVVHITSQTVSERHEHKRGTNSKINRTLYTKRFGYQKKIADEKTAKSDEDTCAKCTPTLNQDSAVDASGLDNRNSEKIEKKDENFLANIPNKNENDETKDGTESEEGRLATQLSLEQNNCFVKYVTLCNKAGLNKLVGSGDEKKIEHLHSDDKKEMIFLDKKAENSKYQASRKDEILLQKDDPRFGSKVANSSSYSIVVEEMENFDVVPVLKIPATGYPSTSNAHECQEDAQSNLRSWMVTVGPTVTTIVITGAAALYFIFK